MIKVILYPPKQSLINSNIVLKMLILIYKPLVYFDTLIKYNSIIYQYYYPLLCKLIAEVNTWYLYDKGFFYYLFNIIPRSLLLSIFLIDVFWLHNIQIFYYFIILGLTPLIYRYIVYTLESAYNYHIQRLEDTYKYIWIFEEDYNPYDFVPNPKAIHHDTKVSIQRYIEIQADAILTYGNDNEYIIYEGTPFPTDDTYKEYCKKYNITEEKLESQDFIRLKEYFEYQYPIMLGLYLTLNSNKTITSIYHIPKVTLYISIIYFFTWLYILIVSFHNINNFNITTTILQTFIANYPQIDPYSNITFIHDISYNIELKPYLVTLLVTICKSEYIKILLIGIISEYTFLAIKIDK